MVKAVVLVSIGCHPVTGRFQRAETDAKALEMALTLKSNGVITDIKVVHAGHDEDCLKYYLGMGIPEIDLLYMTKEEDAAPYLVKYLDVEKPDLILCGQAAENSEGSGLLPYLLAEKLDMNIVSSIMHVNYIDGPSAFVKQSLPRGQRRNLEVPIPMIMTLSPNAPRARQSVYGKTRRGKLCGCEYQLKATLKEEPITMKPARKRAKILKTVSGSNTAERLKMAIQSQQGAGKVIIHPSPEEAAEAIYNYLRQEGVIGIFH